MLGSQNKADVLKDVSNGGICMKRFTLLLIALTIVLSTATAFASDFDKTIISSNEDGDIFTFPGLNPVIDIAGCPMLYTPHEVYLNLFYRGVPIDMYNCTYINNRKMLLILLEDGEQFAFDCLETYGDTDFVLEETVYQFCMYFFGEEYDFLSSEPDDWRE